MRPIVSLHTTTEYSFLESTIKIDSLISFALEHNLKALAITDHNSMFGVAEFVHKCKNNGIKPIIGLDLDVEDCRLILLAKNYDGYKHLISLSSRKVRNEEITLQDIDDLNIYIIDHPTKGFWVTKKKEIRMNNFFIATDENKSNAIFVKETRTLSPDDNEAIRIVDSLKKGELIKEEYNYDGYIYEVSSNDSQHQQVNAIVDDCNVEFPKYKNPVPRYKNGEGLTSSAYLKKVLNENAKEVLKHEDDKEAYSERIKYEISIIEKLGFEDYFLIIWDLIKWSKEQGIIIGPGRGSAAGSLIAYVLGITEIDPLKYDLIFERFLNPERVTMPDIDIDIQDNRREEVVKYIFDKYGQANTGLISTYQKLAAKSSLRDVARLLGISNGDVTELTKMVPLDATLEQAYAASTRFRAAIDKSELLTKLFELAKKIEGLPRQHGTHAAGLVISDNPLVEQVPTITSTDGFNQLQYSMDHLEENGLLKIDLLGLRNLTILQSIQEEIYKNYQKRVDLRKIPTHDEQTDVLLSSGETNGIFQLESYGMKKTLAQVQVTSINDVVAILSLYRPGPMEFIGIYAKRKKGLEQIEKISPEYDAIVKDTQGIIVYQEQIMKIAQVFASMSFGQADILRRAIGKKKIALINSLKEAFIKGAINNGHSEELALKVYAMIERFADYGFNKSHAVAYSTLSYRMAYLKARFPFEFYTALLEASVGSLKSMQLYIEESKKRSIEIVAPNINISREYVFNKNQTIVLPLGIIKGLGGVANAKIIQEREKNGAYKDFFDLVARLKINSLGESAVMALIKGGALRDFGNMQTLIDSLPQATRYTNMITVSDTGEKSIDFTMLAKPKLIFAEPDFDAECSFEKEVYGFNISSFPTTPFEKENRLIDIKGGKKAIVAARVVKIKKMTDRNGQTMGVITLSDSTTSIDLFAFYNVFKFIEKTKKNSIVEVELHSRIDKNGVDRVNIVSPWKDVKNG